MVDFTTYQARSGSLSLLPRSVVGDVDPVAFLAPAVVRLRPRSFFQKIFFGERVSVDAPLLGRLCMFAVRNLIEGVLAVGPVRQVRRDVVHLVPIQVPCDETFGSRSVEHQCNDVVNAECLANSVVAVECDARVSAPVDMRGENPTVTPPASESSDFPQRVGSVAAEAGNVYPLVLGDVIHDDNYTSEKVQVGARNG